MRAVSYEPDDVPEWEVRGPIRLIDAMVLMGLAKSKTEARNLIRQGAVTVWHGGAE